MKKIRIDAILSFTTLFLMIPFQNINSTYSYLILGRIYTVVPNPSVKVGQLQDTAYTYTGVDIVVNDCGVDVDTGVTVVVIDQGLNISEWKALEQNPEANV
ncbi:hypothetical protein EU534_00935, partial [Candidatus Heimdallarchaeota archaeon]